MEDCEECADQADDPRDLLAAGSALAPGPRLAGLKPHPAWSVLGPWPQPSLPELPALLGEGRRARDDGPAPSQQRRPLAEGAVWEDRVVTGSQQRQVITYVISSG